MSIVTMTEETRKGMDLIGTEPTRLIGWLEIILGSALFLDPNGIYFSQLIAPFGVAAELFEIGMGILLLGAGMLVLTKQNISIWRAVLPLFLFLVTNAGAIFKLPVPKAGGILSIALFFALISICDFYRINQEKTDALAHKDKEIADLKAHILEIEKVSGDSQ